MKTLSIVLTAALACAALALAADEPAPEDLSKPFELLDGDTVVFLGGEFIEQDIKHNYLEAMLTARWPDRRIAFRNLGWSGDTPEAESRGYFGGKEEGYRRLMEELQRLKPTVIFVEYGSVGSYGGADGLKPFMASFDKLVGDLRKITGRVVIMSPPSPEPLAKLGGDLKLLEARAVYASVLKVYAKEHGLRYVDLFAATHDALRDERITHDTIRYNAVGYDVAAHATLESLALKAAELDKTRAAELRALIAAKNDLYFHRYRPQNETYLRGFRKHEQGQNAAEIPLFDAMIAKQEDRIAAFVQGKELPAEVEAIAPKPRTVDALDPEDERRELKVPDGFEINLFASEPMVKNPIHMNFDARGRLWVATSPIYPQIMPGAKASDQIVVLEDTDGDGRADKSTVFADDLLIPTAVLPDDKGGAYVANSTELIHLADTDGDGKADTRHVVLAGFGTEDTHHILHTFMWGPDGSMYFNQSIYIHTHAETPHGVVRLLGSGIWRFDTDTRRAEVVSRGLVNPWGHVFNRWGTSFATDGAGGEGINYAFRGSVFMTAVGYDRILRGMNPGQPKHCGLVVVSGRGFPDDWQDTLVTADFRGNRINRFALEAQGSGYISKQQPDVVTSTHRAFRPVDLKMGPDGAVYIADWYNPIINHGEVDFRDPRRDTEHGRIWRVIRKDAPKIERIDFEKATTDELVKMLESPEQYARNTARRQLALRDRDEVYKSLDRWLNTRVGSSEKFDRVTVEALWAFRTTDRIDAGMLEAASGTKDPRVRAVAMRLLADWAPRTDNGRQLLEAGVTDDHAQVRLEAVNTARYFDSAEAAVIAMKALDKPMDEYLDFALWQTMRTLESRWLSEFQAGKIDFGGDAKKVAFAIKAIENPAALAPLVELLRNGKLDEGARRSAMKLIGDLGRPEDLAVVFDLALNDTADRDWALGAMIDAARRGVRPTGDLNRITRLLDHPSAPIVAGFWRTESAHPKLVKIAGDADSSDALRQGAMIGLAGFEDRAALTALAAGDRPTTQRRMAIVALAGFDPGAAAGPGAALLSDAGAEGESQAIFGAFVTRQGGPDALAAALDGKNIPAPIAALGLRSTPQGNKATERLRIVLERSAVVATMPQQLTPDELAALVKQIETTGDAHRGEAIYRRATLACTTCHAIAGGGGKVGPDLVSLGASAPVDYIVESLLEPSKKIKEGYHTVSVTTSDGAAIAGTLVREGGGQTVVRDATGAETAIPDAKIQTKTIVPVSLMPPGLTATLSRDEFVDLAAFMAALGKEGAFKAPAKAYVRKWIIDGGVAYSRVDGTLPAEEVASKWVRFEVNVTAAGPIALKLNDTSNTMLRRAGGEILGDDPIDLPVGRHTFVADVHRNRAAPLSVEIGEVDGSSGRATPVNE